MVNPTTEPKTSGFIDDRAAKQAEALKKLPAALKKNYFEVDPKTKKYVRKFANVVEIDNERAVLRIDGEDWAIPSAYDLLDLVDGDWILGHAYPGLDGKKKFFPLGPDNEFIEARDARNAFLPTDITSAKESEAVKAAITEQNDLKAQFLRLAGEIAGVHTSSAEFGQALGQIIENAKKIAEVVPPATGQVNAATARDLTKTPKGRTPVPVRPRNATFSTSDTKNGQKRRGRGMARVRSHFKEET